MDMGMDTGTSNSSMIMMMKPYIHFTPGDILFFSTWVPTTPGAFFGACLALFAVALFERFVAAIGRVVEAQWTSSPFSDTTPRKSSASITSRTLLNGDKDSQFAADNASVLSQCEVHKASTPQRLSAPFIPRIELQRGALRAGGAVLGYVLMLAVMTFNAGLILSIIVGLGVGEVVFGRFGAV